MCVAHCAWKDCWHLGLLMNCTPQSTQRLHVCKQELERSVCSDKLPCLIISSVSYREVAEAVVMLLLEQALENNERILIVTTSL